MAIWIDPPAWPAHGTLWSHLVSDDSYRELHAFAAAHGVPRRGFERDHYDVPEEAYRELVAAGARAVSSRELVRRLSDAGLRRRKADAPARRSVGNDLLRPPRLRVGDLVAVPATSSPVPPLRFQEGVAVLEGWGLRVRVLPHALDTAEPLGYLAGDDSSRAADFTAAWLDDEVAAIVVGRGGYGAQRIIDLLDWRRLAEPPPKILVGFSDVTALHQAVASRLGLVTLHAHVATSLATAEADSAETMRAMLFEPEAVDLLRGSPATAVVPGTATGVLVGGNLAVLAAEVGTPFSRLARGGIVLLEDVDESPYRIDRLLTQLLRSGWFEGVRGIVAGAFTRCGDPEAVELTLRDRLAPLGVPFLTGFDAGHTPTSRSVPLGVRATLEVRGSASDRGEQAGAGGEGGQGGGGAGGSLRLAAPPFS